MKESLPKVRPYWHVDAKWITGLLLVFLTGITLFIYTLSELTAEKPAVDALGLGLALLLSNNGLDDETAVAQIRSQVQASPGKSIQPFPGLSVTIREQDLADRTPREVRLFIFSGWARVIYRGGAEGFAALAYDPTLNTQILAGGAPYNILTLKTHQSLQDAVSVLASICLVLLIPLVIFSHHFGRIASPGWVLVFASLPGSVVFGFLSILNHPVPATPPAADAGFTGMIGYLAGNLMPLLAPIAARGYLIFLGLGFGLVVFSGLCNFTWWLWRKIRRATARRKKMCFAS